jgi:hypothetical protein
MPYFPDVEVNMQMSFRLLDTVALTKDVPEHGLSQGQVGTVVDAYYPGVYEVEFSDQHSRPYANVSLHAEQLMLLFYEPVLVF